MDFIHLVKLEVCLKLQNKVLKIKTTLVVVDAKLSRRHIQA